MTFVVFLLGISYADAQQGNVWALFDNQGLDFNTGKPKVIFSKLGATCSQVGNRGYSASISDCNGNLLIYSSGGVTYNGKHDTIRGAASCNYKPDSYSGKAIMERKDSAGKYILVYGIPHLNIQLIDMNANGGDGNVYKIMNGLVLNLFSGNTHSFDIQYHPNDTDYWIIGRPNGSYFRVIQFSPIYGVKQIIDSYDNQNSFAVSGNNGRALRFSRKGDLLVTGGNVDALNPYSTYIYDFDKLTGKVSNPIPLTDSTIHPRSIIYDFEFSPDDSFVYYTANDVKAFGKKYFVQCNIKNRTAPYGNIVHTITNAFAPLHTGISLGSDNKLYISKAPQSKNISVIHNPDREYPACNFVENEITMPNDVGHFFPKNLQEIHQLFVNNSSGVKELCNDTTWYAIKGDTAYYGNYIVWWGDGDSSVFDNSGLNNVYHIYQIEGNYEISLQALTKECKAPIWRFDSAFVHFQPRAKLYLDTLISCEKREILFQDSIGSSKNYEFLIKNINTQDTILFENDTTSTYSVALQSFLKNKNTILYKNDSFLFSLVVNNQWGCKAKDSLIYIPDIDTLPSAAIDLIGDSSGCRLKEIYIQNNSITSDSTLMIWGDGNNLKFDEFQYDLKKHIYDSVNNFNPFIIAKNLDGCLDTFHLSQTINIIGTSKMDYTLNIDSTCKDVKLTIKDNSLNADYILTLIQRQITGDTLLFDSANSTGNTLQWTTVNKENISILRTVKNAYCFDDSLQNQSISPKQKPRVKIITNPDVRSNLLCEPASINFNDSLIDANTVGYTVDTSQTHSILINYIVTFKAGLHRVILKDSANNGCTNSDTIDFIIQSQPEYNYVLNVNTKCDKYEALITTNSKDRVIDSVEIVWEKNKIEQYTIGGTPIFNAGYVYDFVTKDSIRQIYITTKNINSCVKKDTLSFQQNSYRILNAPNVLGVTVSNDNETTLEWIDIPNVKNYEISSSTKGNTISGISPYISKNEPTDKTPISYYINAVDTCGIKGQTSRLSKSILLTGKVVENTTAIEPQDEAVLTWTPYEEWFGGVLNYYLQLKDENGNFNTVSTFNSNIGYTDTTFHHAELGQYCYRIIAEENGGNKYGSYSNIVCLNQKPWVAIPNSFTPNGDGLNDVFAPHFLSLKNARVLIIDKWGEILYDYEGNNPRWDGTFNNKPVQDGIYVIQISAQYLSGKKANFSGIINLMR